MYVTTMNTKLCKNSLSIHCIITKIICLRLMFPLYQEEYQSTTIWTEIKKILDRITLQTMKKLFKHFFSSLLIFLIYAKGPTPKARESISCNGYIYPSSHNASREGYSYILVTWNTLLKCWAIHASTYKNWGKINCM